MEEKVKKNAEEEQVLPEEVEIIGLKFKDTGKTYYFDPKKITLAKGDDAIVETARGLEYGTVSIGNKTVKSSEVVPPLRAVVRKATGVSVPYSPKISYRRMVPQKTAVGHLVKFGNSCAVTVGFYVFCPYIHSNFAKV